MKTKGISAALVAIAFALAGLATVLAGSSEAAAQIIYAPDFVSAVAYGVAMNDAGDIVGTSYTDPGCGPFCLAPIETVVWKAGVRIVLPPLPGHSGTAVTGINNQGWICGYAGSFDFPRAVVWKPNGNTYTVIDLGTLPGTNMLSAAKGIDDLGRVVGFSSSSNLPPGGAFLWTEAGGMVDLTKQGFPSETPRGISRGGTVATSGHWYHLGDPTSVTALAPVPPGGWFGFGGPVAINDAGDQARGLGIGNEHPFTYMFRYHHEGTGTWQQIDFTGTGPQSPGGIGSINNAQDITNTVSGSAQIAYGPDGINQPLDALFSPAYNSSIIRGGPMNASSQILAQIWVGLAGRLVRLTPASACGASCIRVSKLVVSAKFHQDPNDLGHCTPGNKKEYNLTHARAVVTSETGARLSGVLVSGRFMDQYWTNALVSGTTNAQGIVQFNFKGPCGVGTEAFIVENATKAPLVFDKTVGVLAGSALPKF
jgi:probable HAF family extracellular repeat protein